MSLKPCFFAHQLGQSDSYIQSILVFSFRSIVILDYTSAVDRIYLCIVETEKGGSYSVVFSINDIH